MIALPMKAALVIGCFVHMVMGFAPLSSPMSKSSQLLGFKGDFGDIKLSEIPYGEESRRYRRTYYENEMDWIVHRSDDRFLANMAKTFRSGIVRSLASEITIVASSASLVCFYNALFVAGWQDFSGALHDPIHILPDTVLPLASLPTEPFSLSSPALGLLLVFRTNASFGRWSEARNKWSAIQDHCRNIIRTGAAWIPADLDKAQQRELVEDLGDNVWGVARSLQRHLLGEREDGEVFKQDVKKRMKPKIAQNLIDAPVKPHRALFELTKAVNAIPMTEHRHVELDRGVEHLCDSWGGCDKLLRTPVPLVYTRHTARFLGFWILALPLGLWKAFASTWNHLGVVVAAVLIAFFFFGIEELAIQLEEPFSILPIGKFVENVETSVDEIVTWHFEDDEEDAHDESANGLKRLLSRVGANGET